MSWQWSVPGIRNEFLYKRFKEMLDSGVALDEAVGFLAEHTKDPFGFVNQSKLKMYWDAYNQETK